MPILFFLCVILADDKGHEIIQSLSKYISQINKLEQTYTIYICLKMLIVSVQFDVNHKYARIS